MPDEPMADVVARVLACEDDPDGLQPCAISGCLMLVGRAISTCMDHGLRPAPDPSADAVTLAREVERLREALEERANAADGFAERGQPIDGRQLAADLRALAASREDQP